MIETAVQHRSSTGCWCSHTGAVLLQVSDIRSRGTLGHSKSSQLSGWNAPKRRKVEAQPLENITFTSPRINSVCADASPVVHQEIQAPETSVDEGRNAVKSLLEIHPDACVGQLWNLHP